MGILTMANVYETQAVSAAIVVAKKNLILNMWKSNCTPTYDMWINMVNMLHLEDRWDSLTEEFDQIWWPTMQHIKMEERWLYSPLLYVCISFLLILTIIAESLPSYYSYFIWVRVNHRGLPVLYQVFLLFWKLNFRLIEKEETLV